MIPQYMHNYSPIGTHERTLERKLCDIFPYRDISMEPNEGKDIREYHNHV